MKNSELKDKNEKELDKMLAELREKLRDLRFRIAARRLTGVREVRETRKSIARILTARRSRKES